VSEIFREHRN